MNAGKWPLLWAKVSAIAAEDVSKHTELTANQLGVLS